jgi:hypothetical protein
MKNELKFMGYVIFLITFTLAFSLYAAGVFAASQKITKQELIKVYDQVREAINKGNLQAFEQLVIPPDPNTPKATLADLADMKVFLDELLPDLSKARFHRFEKTPSEALIVAQTNLKDQDTINLNAFRFKNQNGRWMLWASFVGHSFSSENPQADKKNISKILHENPGFKLQAKST